MLESRPGFGHRQGISLVTTQKNKPGRAERHSLRLLFNLVITSITISPATWDLFRPISKNQNSATTSLLALLGVLVGSKIIHARLICRDVADNIIA